MARLLSRLHAGPDRLPTCIPGRETVCARSVNAVSLPGNAKGKSGSGGLAVLEHELELGLFFVIWRN